MLTLPTAAREPRADPGVGSWLAALDDAQRAVLAADDDPQALAQALASAAAWLTDAHCRVALLDGDRERWTATCGALDLTGPGEEGSSLRVELVHAGAAVGTLELAAGPPDWFEPVDHQAAAALAAVAAARVAPAVAQARRTSSAGSGQGNGPGDGTGTGNGTRDRLGADVDGPPTPPAAFTVPRRSAGRTPPNGVGPNGVGPNGIGPNGIGEAALQAAQELTGLGLWEWDPQAGRLEWSPEMFRLAGEPAEGPHADGGGNGRAGRAGRNRQAPDLAGWLALVHPEDRARARALVEPADRPGSTRVETFRMVGRDGVTRHVQSWATVVAGERPVVCGATLDVSGQVNDRETLQRLSATDPVTGLGNRLAFDRLMKDLLARPGTQVALLLLDLDRFKQVNDTLGHQVGDRLLVEVARRLNRLLPEGCAAVRMGGDEFVVVPPVGLGPAGLRRLAQTLVDELRAPYVLPDSQEMLVCPVSVGVTSSAGRLVSSHDLLREADLALYRAKDSGRDRFVVFDDVLRARAQARSVAERSLRTALEEDRLVLQYQPIVDFADGRVVGAEALVRMRDPHGERLLGPDAFIAVAEDTGLVVELDCWVIDAAVAQATAWLQRSPRSAPWLAVNVSARSMEHPRVARRLVDAVGPGRLPAGRLKVELTEHSFLDTLPGGDSAVRTLLSNGIPVGIDDFGTGYSALAYLQRFDLDFMKIDRSFVAEVGEQQRADAVVTAIVDLAHAHGMKVTAEGVETPRQARRLREIGCDLAQGYHFGRPGAAARIVRG